MIEIRYPLQEVLDKIQQKETQVNQKVKKNLNKILTKKETQHIKYISLGKSCLKLGVDSSLWLYQLHQKQDAIKEALQVKEVKIFLA